MAFTYIMVTFGFVIKKADGLSCLFFMQVIRKGK